MRTASSPGTCSRVCVYLKCIFTTLHHSTTIHARAWNIDGEPCQETEAYQRHPRRVPGRERAVLRWSRNTCSKQGTINPSTSIRSSQATHQPATKRGQAKPRSAPGHCSSAWGSSCPRLPLKSWCSEGRCMKVKLEFYLYQYAGTWRRLPAAAHVLRPCTEGCANNSFSSVRDNHIC
jgi:hypothetical protein